MEQTIQTTDAAYEQKGPLPGSLNVLTILTFIGCGLQYIFSIFQVFSSKDYETQHAKLIEAQDKVGDSGFARKMLDKAIDTIEKNQDYINKAYEYRYIIFACSVIFITLCLVGAIQMRKLKKTGYFMYVIGEIAPVLIMFLLLGWNSSQLLQTSLSLIIPVVFIILYSTQRKYLVNP
jgi:hypothetical protein